MFFPKIGVASSKSQIPRITLGPRCLESLVVFAALIEESRQSNVQVSVQFLENHEKFLWKWLLIPERINDQRFEQRRLMAFARHILQKFKDIVAKLGSFTSQSLRS